MDLLILSATDVSAALPMSAAIEAMKNAFIQLWMGHAEVPLRTHLQPAPDSATLVMPAFLAESGDLAVKIVSIFPGNPSRKLPTIHGLVLALDAETGRPLALLEGGTLTAIRTGAASGAATDLLARHDARVVSILGSGVQARTQLEAVCTVRDIEKVFVSSPNRNHAQQFAVEMAGRGPVPNNIVVASGANEAVRQADIICAATTSLTPVFDGRFLKPGAHVNGAGSFTPGMQEIDAYTVRNALIVVDSRPAVLAEAGDLLVPLAGGEISEDDISAELGELAAGAHPGRTSPDQITFFKSVGVAVQDAAAASVALANALAGGLGTKVAL